MTTLKQIAEKANQIKTIIGLVIIIIGWAITIGAYKNKIDNMEKTFEKEFSNFKEELVSIESSFEKALMEVASRNVEVKSLQRSHQIRYEELLTKVQYRN